MEMAQIDEKLLQQAKAMPDRKIAFVVTVDDRFSPSAANSLGLKEIQAKRLYAGSLPGKAIVSLSKQDGVLAIEPDFDVSVN
jgi:hypothetical protein